MYYPNLIRPLNATIFSSMQIFRPETICTSESSMMVHSGNSLVCEVEQFLDPLHYPQNEGINNKLENVSEKYH